VNWLFRRKKGRARATTSTAGLDERTLQELAKAGGNLAMPTEIVNYLYVPDETGAHAAGAELQQAGYQVEVRPAATGKQWLTMATIVMVPSTSNIALLRDRFESLAERLGGDYDGWEAAVTR
jgi:regulator of ribonuclease activity B